jgi:diguanylate cyclase (GGDEF)-like protein/PAS domain S-box-containing protein
MDRVTSKPALVAEALALIAAPACACDAQGMVWAANAALADLVALRGAQLEGRPLLSLFAARTAGAAAVQIRRSLSGEQRWHALLDCAGADLAVEVRARPLPAAAGIQGATFVFHDAPDPCARACPGQAADAAGAAAATALEHAAILEHAPVGIVVTLPDLVKSCNPRMAEMLGLAPGEMIGRSPSEVFAARADYDAFRAEAIPQLAAGRLFEKDEVQLRRRDGTPIWCRIRAKAVDTADREAGTVWILEDVTEARQALTEVQAIMTNASIAIFFTRDRVIGRHNGCFSEMFGYAPGAAAGLSTRVLYGAEAPFRALGEEAYAALGQGRSFKTETAMVRSDGTPMWVSMIGYAVNPVERGRGTIIWMVEDRTAARRDEESLRDALLENRAILDNAVLGIAVVQDGGMIHCNRKMEELFGYDCRIDGVTVRELYPDAAAWKAARSRARCDFASGRVHMAEVRMRRRDGSVFWARLSGRPFDMAQQRGRSVWLIDDVTAQREAADALRRARDELEVRVQERTAELQAEIVERRQAEARVHHMAYHDALTGLPNRALLAERLACALQGARADDRRLALLFIDLDRFKTINDSLGHLAGDHLLKEVGARLCRVVRAADTVARLGGDEFVVLVPGVRGAEESGAVAEKIIGALADPVMFEGRGLHISPSIGICLYPDDGADVTSLMRKADAAMYQAKAAGRNNYQFYAERMNGTAERHFELETRLRGALQRQEFALFYQPIVATGDRRVHALEVLLRWRDPEQGLVAPDEFIPILEENGLIVPVGEWVIRAACEQAVAWRRAGLPALPLAINLSARQFMHRGLIQAIRRIVDETGIDPSLLEFEITETALMQHGGLTLETLGHIYGMGIRLSIDDFGTGYSSLAYLKRFPVRKIKIDRAFMRDLEASGEDQAIVAAIMALAGSLQLAVVAEGVETAGQLEVLRGQGCQYAQGYLFARPMEGAWVPGLLAGQDGAA